MAAAARLSPKDFFTDQEWAPISARSYWRGPAMIAHAWALILAAGAMVVVEHRVDDRRLARGAVPHHVADGVGGFVEKGMDLGGHGSASWLGLAGNMVGREKHFKK